MCRLSTSVIEEINEYEIFKDTNEDIDNFMNLLNLILKDKDNNSIYSDSLKNNFDLYINIAKNACNGIPYNIINHKVFKKYKISKKLFQKNIILLKKELYNFDLHLLLIQHYHLSFYLKYNRFVLNKK